MFFHFFIGAIGHTFILLSHEPVSYEQVLQKLVNQPMRLALTLGTKKPLSTLLS